MLERRLWMRSKRRTRPLFILQTLRPVARIIRDGAFNLQADKSRDESHSVNLQDLNMKKSVHGRGKAHD